MNQRVRILRDTNAGPCIVSVKGQQYSFTLEGAWVSDVPPRTGMMVDVTFNSEGVPVAVQAVPENQIVKEQAQQALEGAKAQSAQFASRLQARFGTPLLIAVVLLVVGWFFLTCVTLQGPRLSYTFWQMLGFAGDGQALYTVRADKNTLSSSGIYGVLALLSLISPFARFFWKDRRAPLTEWLPLLTMLLVAFEIRSALQNAFEHATGLFGRLGSDPHAWQMLLHQLDPSLGVGTYLSSAAALYLAWDGTRHFLVGRATVGDRNLLPAHTAM